MRIASVGHAVFAGTMIALGMMGLIKDDFTRYGIRYPSGCPYARYWSISAPSSPWHLA
jgi:hypothetical protein